MKRFLIYSYFEIKNSIKVMGKSIMNMMIMFIFLILGVTAVSFCLRQSQVFEKLIIAVCIPQQESEMQMATRYISNLDSVKNISEFLYMEEKKAWEEMESGNIDAIISFPDNFFEDVYRGINTPARITLSDRNHRHITIFKELLSSGISFLQISEAGVYASLDQGRKSDTIIKSPLLGDYIASLYAKEILKRDKTFEKEIISPFGRYSYEQFFLSSAFLSILLMSSLHFGYLYRKNNKVIVRKLKIEGIGCCQITFVRIFIMGMFLWLLSLVLYVGTLLVTKVYQMDIMLTDFKGMSGLLLLCISMASFFHMIYSISDDNMNGTIFLLMINMFMILSTGILLPVAYMPEWIEKLGNILPLRYWSRFGSEFIFGSGSVETAIPIIFIGILSSGIGMVALWKNISSGIS